MAAPLLLGRRAAAGAAAPVRAPRPLALAAACPGGTSRVEIARSLRPARRLARRSAAEEGAGLSTADNDDKQEEEGAGVPGNGSSVVESTSQYTGPGADVLQKARDALAEGTADAAFLESLLPQLETELSSLAEADGAAEEKSSQLEAELQNMNDKYLRLSADFDNFKKRSAAERDRTQQTVKGDIVTQFLPLVDNFELAKSQVKCNTEEEEKINNSYQGLYRQMVDVFKALGVEAVDAVGQPFDPNVHEAVMREPNDDVPDQTVLEEFRRGFALGDRLIRPAMVKVSASEAPAPNAGEGDGEDDTGSEADAEKPVAGPNDSVEDQNKEEQTTG
ncbi:unnamed protein product [Ostreobium quekettii]|uniref:GrpE protein homolog n=1 Tax=Ostreobium quekettii TaxID=121088 RepID=A0A8S1IP06_9CHLO|nr:unnamed protein product [Ostreobium quekettii]|eukprot:evm.model.scf_322.1 EVM.evm.TU.scf_322.1   scf_322:41504-49512(+)